MLKRRKLACATIALGCAAAVFGLSALPAASDSGDCTVTVTVAGGQQFTFYNVPEGTPASALRLPVKRAIERVLRSCPTRTTPATTPTVTTPTRTPTVTTPTTTPTVTKSTTTPTTTTTTPTTTTTTPSTTTSTGTTQTTPTTTTKTTTTTAPKHHPPSTSTTPTRPASPPKTKGPGKRQSTSQRQTTTSTTNTGRPAKRKTSSRAKPKKASPTRTRSGAPAPTNPAYAYAAPGPAAIGVPNFFIDSFQIPPFLLPIYQAAGIEYDVPWQVLAAINWIETDYGQNLNVSSAGAVGWMQFLPSTWREYAVDATGSGYADPYNPADAIFTAARYLHAAGASTNLAGAIYAYNHAEWYVQSVLLRAQLIGGMPNSLVGALTDLVEGHFPVAAAATYADDSVDRLAGRKVSSSNAAISVASDPTVTGTAIYAKQGSPVIAVNDGKVIGIGQSPRLGKYLELQDSTGNVYTYADLGSIPRLYPVPKPAHVTAAEISRQVLAPSAPAPKQPATAGSQRSAPTVSTATASKELRAEQSPRSSTATASTPAATVATPMVKERLFADPRRPASYAAGGDLQIKNSTEQAEITNFDDYFSDVLHLGKNQYTLQRLKLGSIVVAGTILGRIGAGTPTDASHLEFMIQPGGVTAPYIDPEPILDGWQLLAATAIYRADGVDPFTGKGASVGQILLMSKAQLQNRVLSDPHVQIYACGRRDIQAGLIDRRVLAVIEFLSASGLDPTVSGLACGATANAADGVDAAGKTGESVDISAINNIPIEGHQGPGSIADVTIRRLLTLQGAMAPDEIVSLMSYKGQSSTLALPNHANRIQIAYTPLYGKNKQLSTDVAAALEPGQWVQLIDHLSQIPEPVVPIAPSKYAIKVGSSG